jgi:photosystem II stability/assembly factor-like uncharacterized protein
MIRSNRGTARCIGLAVLGVTVALAGMAPPAVAATPARQAAVPSGFKANSITWASPQQGWVLGAAPCGAKTCTDVIGTTDGATTWKLLGRVNAPIARLGQAANPGVTEIRFATPMVGWAFGPHLFQTVDGGRSWAKMTIPGQGQQVFSLAANGTEAYAVVSPCRWARYCHQPLSFWRTTTLTGGSWTRIPLNLPSNIGADVAVFGPTVYVTDPQADLNGGNDVFYASIDGGRHFSTRPVPCDNTQVVSLIQVVPTSATDVSLLCDGNPGFSQADKSVYRSTDTAKTDTFAGRMGSFGIQAQLAVSPSGNLAVASWSDGSFIYINDTKTSTNWKMPVALSDGGAGWNDVVYVTNQEAWVVYAPPDFYANLGQLYVTHDGGRTWTLAPL